VWTGDGWSATNTDATAVRTCVGRALCAQDRKLAGSTAVVVGTGGAARAALHGLRGANLVVAGRDAQKTAELARAFGARACEPAQIGAIAHDVLVHATPLGSKTHPDVCPVPADALRARSIVLDAVYRPADTPLLRAARAAGAVAIPGAEWFLEQALAQFRAFTGQEPPADAMRSALTSALAAEDTA
jgi:shikimate dehydrogenase